MTNVGYATVTIIPVAKGFQQALSNQVNPQLRTIGITGGASFGTGFLQSAKKMAAPLAALVAGGAVAAAFKDAIAGAAAEDQAIKSLGITLTNLGQGSQLAGVEATISSLSKMSSIADDTLRPSFQTLFTAAGSVTTATEGLTLALDVAAGTGRTVDEVSFALAKGYSGQVTALSRLGAGIDKSVMSSGDMVAITDALTQKFKGQATAAATGYAGTLRGVSVAAGELSDSFGGGFLRGFTSATAVGRNLSDTLYAMGPAADAVGQAAGQAAAGLERIAAAAGSAYTEMNKPVDEQSFLAKLGTMVWHIGTTDLIDLTRETMNLSRLDESAAAKASTLTRAMLDGTWSIRAITAEINDNIGVAPTFTSGLSAGADATDTLTRSATTAKSAIDQLADSLTATNGAARTLLSGRSALAQQWADLATMGDTVTKGRPASTRKDIHGKTIQVPSTQRQVQLPFDPATKGGRFDLTQGSGRAGANWLTQTAQAAETLAQALFAQGKPIRAQNLLDSQRGRVAGQLDEWGLARPRAVSAAVLATPNIINQAADARRGANVAGDRLAGVVNNYNITGDIKVNSAAEITRTAHELARLKALSGGQIPAAAS